MTLEEAIGYVASDELIEVCWGFHCQCDRWRGKKVGYRYVIVLIYLFSSILGHFANPFYILYLFLLVLLIEYEMCVFCGHTGYTKSNQVKKEIPWRKQAKSYEEQSQGLEVLLYHDFFYLRVIFYRIYSSWHLYF